MKLILCVDDKGGMAFHGRRQSMDRLLRADLLAMVGETPIWMTPYSAKQFDPIPANLHTVEDFLDRAGTGEYCFAEFPPLAPWLDRTEGLVVYRWNRVYPADAHLDFDPTAQFVLDSTAEFHGFSHKILTKEVYIR